MKKLLSIAALLISLSVSAQGNLQFNQVINGSIDANIYQTGVTAGTITIPAGKVWKLESVSHFTSPGSTNQSISLSNSSRVFIGDHQVWNGLSNYQISNFPIWFSEGTYSIVIGDYHNSTTPHRFSWSAIEFNVVP